MLGNKFFDRNLWDLQVQNKEILLEWMCVKILLLGMVFGFGNKKSDFTSAKLFFTFYRSFCVSSLVISSHMKGIYFCELYFRAAYILNYTM